jgi:hypothetical protein
VHVKTYNVTGHNVVWLEEWYLAYYITDFYMNFAVPKEVARLVGYVTDEGQIVIEHGGGPPLINYTIYARYINGTTLIDNTTYKTPDNPWKVGDAKYILPNLNLTKDDMVQVTIYEIYEDGWSHIVFDGILRGK